MRPESCVGDAAREDELKGEGAAGHKAKGNDGQRVLRLGKD